MLFRSLRCLNFLETPDAGTITVQDKVLFDADHHANCSEKEIRKNRLHFGMVFQSFNLFPQYTALENVTLARELMAKDSGESKEAIRAAECRIRRLWRRLQIRSPASGRGLSHRDHKATRTTVYPTNSATHRR